MEVRLFGSLFVIINGRTVKITAPKERVLLAALAMDAGKPASLSRLCQLLWNEDYSARLDGVLRPLVGRLRRTLGDDRGLIVTESGAYRLDIGPDDVDVLAFEALYMAGRAAIDACDWQRALDALTRAEALWQGDPFADVPSEYLREKHVGRLEARFSLVREKRAETAVRSYPPRAAADLVPDIRELIRDNPGNEHLRWLLMLALYRAGQQGLAMTTYHETWKFCMAETGQQPNVEIQKLNQRIIDSDPSLLCVPYRDLPEN